MSNFHSRQKLLVGYPRLWNIGHLTDIIESLVNDLEMEANNDVMLFTDLINVDIFLLTVGGNFRKKFPLSQVVLIWANCKEVC